MSANGDVAAQRRQAVVQRQLIARLGRRREPAVVAGRQHVAGDVLARAARPHRRETGRQRHDACGHGHDRSNAASHGSPRKLLRRHPLTTRTLQSSPSRGAERQVHGRARVVHDVSIEHACTRGHRMCRDSLVVEDVLHRGAVDEDEVVGEQPAVAAPPHRLRAHDRDAVLRRRARAVRRRRPRTRRRPCDPRSHGTAGFGAARSASPDAVAGARRARRSTGSRARAPATTPPSPHSRSAADAGSPGTAARRRPFPLPASRASAANASAVSVPWPSVATEIIAARRRVELSACDDYSAVSATSRTAARRCRSISSANASSSDTSSSRSASA